MGARGRPPFVASAVLAALSAAIPACGATPSPSLTTRDEAPSVTDGAATASSEDDAAAVHEAVADRVAEEAFFAAEAELRAFESFAIDPGDPATLDDLVGPHGTMLDEIRRGSTVAARISAAYDAVIGRRRPRWTVAALVGQARVYEALARAIQNAPLTLPGIPPPGTPGAPPAGAIPGVMARIRAALEPETRVVECLAVYRYVLALRAARVMSLDDRYTRDASERLHAYDQQRITECVALMRRGDPAHAIPPDPSIAPYRVGELAAGAPAAPPPVP